MFLFKNFLKLRYKLVTPMTGAGLSNLVVIALTVLTAGIVILLGGQITEVLNNQLNVASTHPLHSVYDAIKSNNFGALKTIADFLVIVVLVSIVVIIIGLLLQALAVRF